MFEYKNYRMTKVIKTSDRNQLTFKVGGRLFEVYSQ